MIAKEEEADTRIIRRVRNESGKVPNRAYLTVRSQTSPKHGLARAEVPYKA